MSSVIILYELLDKGEFVELKVIRWLNDSI